MHRVEFGIVHLGSPAKVAATITQKLELLVPGVVDRPSTPNVAIFQIGAVCDTGVISKPECGGIKGVIRLLSIIHNGIILDLVCGFGGSVGKCVRADFPSSFGSRNHLFYWRARE